MDPFWQANARAVPGSPAWAEIPDPESVQGRLDLEQLKALVAEGRVDTVVLACCDIQGRLFGKRVEAGHFLDQNCAGTMACAAVLAWDTELTMVDGLSFVGWHTGYQDIALRPDFSTTRAIAWFPKTVLVLCDALHPNGEDVSTSPRTVLKRQLDRAADMGYDVYSASELEFHLLNETTASARSKHFVGLDLMHDYLADYNLFRSSQDEWFFRQVRNHLTAAGVPIETNKPEYGNGQAEVNLAYAQALEMADRHVIYKQGVRELATLNGFMVTFMAKPFTEHSGSSCHLHMSLWEKGTQTNAFHDPAKPHGMSDVMRHFLGGLQHAADDFFLLYAPFVNSYKRMVPDSFAPCRNAWGLDNRTVSFRVAGEGKACRLENRIPGADTNAYLATAAMLACGLHGIEHSLEPLGPPGEGNVYRSDAPLFPRTLAEAADRFTQSEITRGLLGDDVVDDFAAFAAHELERYWTEVTDWERRNYLELI